MSPMSTGPKFAPIYSSEKVNLLLPSSFFIAIWHSNFSEIKTWAIVFISKLFPAKNTFLHKLNARLLNVPVMKTLEVQFKVNE